MRGIGGTGDISSKSERGIKLLSSVECLQYKDFVEKYQYYLYPLLADEILLQTSFKENPIIIDGGTGPGYLTLEFLKKTKGKVHALDYSPHMLEIAKETLRENGLSSKEVFYDLKDIHFTGYQENYADLVVSYSCLHHWERPAEVLKELYRIIKPGGCIFIFDTFKEAAKDAVPLLKKQISEDYLFRFVVKAFDESYSLDEVEDFVNQADIDDYELVPFSFSEEVIVNNLDLLENLPLEDENGSSTIFCLKISKPYNDN